MLQLKHVHVNNEFIHIKYITFDFFIYFFIFFIFMNELLGDHSLFSVLCSWHVNKWYGSITLRVIMAERAWGGCACLHVNKLKTEWVSGIKILVEPSLVWNFVFGSKTKKLFFSPKGFTTSIKTLKKSITMDKSFKFIGWKM